MQQHLPRSTSLTQALTRLSEHPWQEGELHRRVMMSGKHFGSHQPTFRHDDPEDGKWPWYRVVGFDHYRLYLPRHNSLGCPVCFAQIRSDRSNIDEEEIVSFIHFLMGRRE